MLSRAVTVNVSGMPTVALVEDGVTEKLAAEVSPPGGTTRVALIVRAFAPEFIVMGLALELAPPLTAAEEKTYPLVPPMACGLGKLTVQFVFGVQTRFAGVA